MNYSKVIRDIIRSKYEGTMYDVGNFKKTLLIIHKELIDSNTESDISVVSEFISQYVHNSTKTDEYYFNLKRKQTTKKKDELLKMIISCLNGEDVNIEKDIEDVVNLNDSILSNIPSETDDDIFLKNKQKNESDELVSSDSDSSIPATNNNNNDTKLVNFTGDTKQNSEDDAINTEELADLEKKLFQSFNTIHINKNNNNNTSTTKKTNTIINTNKSQIYVFPIEPKIAFVKRTDPRFGPFGTQWVHDFQIDDVLDSSALKREQQFNKLRAIKLPEQRSKEWFEMRDGAITASDAGVVLGLNKYEDSYTFIIKKCIGKSFESNIFCYHGTKFEEVATMIYAYRTNTTVSEFGLMMHPTIKFLGASPDGICSKFKLDGKTKSKYIGRMLEIKCPNSRFEWISEDVKEISFDPTDKNVVCPIYYWVQVQLQLECCDLDECDFWQCDIKQYNSRNEFINDTDPQEPFRSLSFGYEKGCLIQLLPKNKIQESLDNGYIKTVCNEAKFIYPTKIEMTPYECDQWVAEQVNLINMDKKYFDYMFDRVIYWRLENSRCTLFKRDRKWFNDSLPTFQKMWNYVSFLRKNEMQLNLFKEYMSCIYKKVNADIMKIVENLCDPGSSTYDTFINGLKDTISKNKDKKDIRDNKKLVASASKNNNNNDDIPSGYMFVDGSSEEKPKPKSTKKPIKVNTSNSMPSIPSEYMFTD